MTLTPLLKKVSENFTLCSNRRQFLVGASAVSLAAVVGSAAAAEKRKDDVSSEKHVGLTETAQHCVTTGQACLNHCFDLFKTGDTSLAQCAVDVADTIAACNALAQISLAKATYLKNFAAGCAEVCDACEKECRRNSKHAICRTMAEACADTIQAIKKLT